MNLEQITEYLYHKNPTLAIEVLDTFFADSFHFEQYDEIAKIAFKIKKYAEAIKYAEAGHANALTPEKMWVSRCNLINLYNHANQPEKALRLIRANEAVIPDDVDTRLEKAFSLYLMARRDEAEAILRAEISRPDITPEMKLKIEFNLGTYELYRDNFPYGLELFQNRGRQLGYWTGPAIDENFWTGQDITGQDLYILAEAGIGDEIINIRFTKILKERGINPIWVTARKDLSTMFTRCGYQVMLALTVPNGVKWTYSMSLPVSLNLSYEDLWSGPYLTADPTLVSKYKYLEGKAGIRWQGNPEYDHDLHRSVPLNEILDQIGSNNLVSLQKDTGLEELQNYPGITDLSSKMTSFEETLAIISNLDYVITTCTSVAHASAALGKRTFVFVPISAYYVWSHSTEQSPWYGDHVTILRQEKPRDWTGPISKLKTLLFTNV